MSISIGGYSNNYSIYSLSKSGKKLTDEPLPTRIPEGDFKMPETTLPYTAPHTTQDTTIKLYDDMSPFGTNDDGFEYMPEFAPVLNRNTNIHNARFMQQ